MLAPVDQVWRECWMTGLGICLSIDSFDGRLGLTLTRNVNGSDINVIAGNNSNGAHPQPHKLS